MDKWVRVSSKRSAHQEGQILQKKIPKTNENWLALPTANRYEGLPMEQEVNQPQEETKNKKPPPIFIHAVENIQPLKTLLENIAKGGYQLKQIGASQVKIQLTNAEKYVPTIAALKEKKAQFHSYQLKSEKTFKVVLKGLHHTTKNEELAAEIKELGHDVARIENMRSRTSKQPLPMFICELKQAANNKEIYKVSALCHTKIIIEALRSVREVAQCKNCQRYGHTRQYCNRSPRCVKCAEEHITADCPNKERRKDVKCVNCEGNHPANYKGCSTWKELQSKKFPALRPKEAQPSPAKTATPKISEKLPNKSYAEALKNNEERTSEEPGTQNMAMLITKMDKLMDVVANMVQLITHLITNKK